METIINSSENGLFFHFVTDEKKRLRLVSFGLASVPAPEEKTLMAYSPFVLQGEQPKSRFWCGMGWKENISLPGSDMVLTGFSDQKNPLGRQLVFTTAHENLQAVLTWQFYGLIPIVRATLEVSNIGDRPHTVEAIAPFAQTALFRGTPGDWHNDLLLHTAWNSWVQEVRWQSAPLDDYGLARAVPDTSHRILASNTGTWSAKERLPLGALENTATQETLFWQVESSASWSWEVTDNSLAPQVMLGGLTEHDHHWYRTLKPGEKFTSLPVAVGWVKGGLQESAQVLTPYRRAMRRPHPSYETLPVMFNDYMLCLNADPTEEKELPIIAAAAQAGAEIFVMDAGWYAKPGEGWFGTVGEWQPNQERFPSGLKTLLDKIKAAGMIPGLWLELEVMGMGCSLADQWPDGCFFMRHGKRLSLRGRYQLDFRHPKVIAHCDEVIDRCVSYGAGYIKMDYNIDAGIGTEVAADSPGDGLLQHRRAYMSWLERVMQRHPQLIIENCSSGGLRMDYDLLRLHPIQSSSDQDNLFVTAGIASAAASAVTMEQLAIWAYPLPGKGEEEVILNMVNGLSSRCHLAGRIDQISAEEFSLVQEAVALAKKIRSFMTSSLPIWPCGMPRYGDQKRVFGWKTPFGALLFVWNLKSQVGEWAIPLDFVGEKVPQVQTLYPVGRPLPYQWDRKAKALRLDMPAGVFARVLEIRLPE